MAFLLPQFKPVQLAGIDPIYCVQPTRLILQNTFCIDCMWTLSVATCVHFYTEQAFTEQALKACCCCHTSAAGWLTTSHMGTTHCVQYTQCLQDNWVTGPVTLEGNPSLAAICGICGHMRHMQ